MAEVGDGTALRLVSQEPPFFLSLFAEDALAMPSRSLLVALPILLAAGTGLAWLTTAAAVDTSDVPPALEQAQAPPPSGAPAAGDNTKPRRTFSPKSMCVDRVARAVGYRAALKIRLELKAEQMPKWQAFEKASDDEVTKELARCASLPTDMKTKPNFVDRMNRREEMMKNRLASLEAVKPSLFALYDALTPEQKAVFDRPAFNRDRGAWRRPDRG